MDSNPDRPHVSDWDREYMKRLGRYKEQTHAEALAEHLRRGGRERTEAALAAMLRGAAFASRLPDDDDPSQFYARARELGLYRG